MTGRCVLHASRLLRTWDLFQFQAQFDAMDDSIAKETKKQDTVMCETFDSGPVNKALSNFKGVIKPI